MKRQRKRIAALLLTGAMVLSCMPVNGLAAERNYEGGLCRHHTRHTAECLAQEEPDRKDPTATPGDAEDEEIGECTFVCEICSGDEESDRDHIDGGNFGWDEDDDADDMDDADVRLATSGDAEMRTMVITGFDELPEDVAKQTAEAKTKLEELNLPDTLEASGYEDAQGSSAEEELILEDVEWESDPGYDEEEEQGAYVFTAVLPERYELADGVELPEIEVLVGPVNVLAEAVEYIDCEWDGEEVVETPGSVTDYELATASDAQWGDENDGEHWYVVEGDVTIEERISAIGDVHLILKDDATLNAPKGITVGAGSSLTIYAQSKGDGKGKLIATAGGVGESGIGGGHGESAGTITINGGEIEAIGGVSWGAGIGTGGSSTAKAITINGGTIKAIGRGQGAGIGGGGFSGYIEVITINGGEIEATGGDGGTGIGAGDMESVEMITINGGEIEATGVGRGAGIGCGGEGYVGAVMISGGEIEATGGEKGVGIGIGEGSRGRAITISGGMVKTIGGQGDGIGNGAYYTEDILFSTTGPEGQTGNAVIIATSKAGNPISDQSGKENNLWSGIIIEGNTGMVYGDITPTDDFEIPKDVTVTIPKDVTLTIKEEISASNLGTILNYGTIIGKLGGTIKNSPDVAITFYKDGSEITEAFYGDQITIEATMKDPGKVRAAGKNEVEFLVDGKRLNVVSVETENDKIIARWSVELTGTEWTVCEAGHTITADFGGTDDLLGSSGEALMKVNKATPSLTVTGAADSPTQVTLNDAVITPATGGQITYGISESADAESAKWQTGNVFTGLKASTTYYFFAQADPSADGNYNGAVSEGVPIKTLERQAERIEIISQPKKLVYTVGESLDLTGLEIRIFYDDGTIDEVEGANIHFSAYPTPGTPLTAAHNGVGVVIRSGDKTVMTNPLTVKSATHSNGGSGSGGSSSGGSSSGSSSGSVSAAAPDSPGSDTPSTGVANPLIPDADGHVTVDGSSVQGAIDQAAEEMNQSGNQEHGMAVTIPVSGVSPSGLLTVTISAEALDRLIIAGVRQLNVTAEDLPDLSLSLELLQVLDAQSRGGDLILRMARTSGASDEALEAMGTRPAYEISLVWSKNGVETPLTDWGGTAMTIYLPYSPSAKENVQNVRVISVEADGRITWFLESGYAGAETASDTVSDGPAFQSAPSGIRAEITHLGIFGTAYLTPDIAGQIALTAQ